jgi:hypothetical protein
VQNFLDYYRGRLKDLAPFGGRDSELAFLDAFLQKDGPHRFLLVKGKAGRGKSALLALWYDRLIDGHTRPLEMVFVPVSARYQTHSRKDVYAALGLE